MRWPKPRWFTDPGAPAVAAHEDLPQGKDVTRRKHRASLTGALASLILIAGCGVGGGDSLESAKEYLAKRDHKAALIELKTVLQKSPSSAEARFLYGKALLASGDAASAVVELQRARELKYAEDEVVSELARATVLSGSPQKALEQFGSLELGSAKAKADLKTTLAIAQLSLGRRKEAEAALAAALAAVPKYPRAMLIQARMAGGDGDLDGALGLVDAVIAAMPNSGEALILRGDLLLRGKRDVDAALEAYRKAIAVDTSSTVLGRMSVINALLSRRDVDGAAKELGELKKIAAKLPSTLFLDAQIAYIREDYARARDIALQLLKFAPNNAQVLQLAGVVEAKLGELLQAEGHLTKALKQRPEALVARRTLAATYVRLGQLDNALAAISPALEQSRPDPETLAAAAEIYLMQGKLQQADALYARAVQLRPDSASIRTALALSRLARGDADAAFGELESIAGRDKSDVADRALIGARLRRGELDAALTAIDALERKQPGKPEAAYLRGSVLARKQDFAGARANLTKALSADAKYFPAVAALAALDVEDGRADEAQKRFEQIVKDDPRHLQARLSIVDLRSKADAPPEEIEALLKDTVKAVSLDPVPRVMLIKHYLQHKQGKAALAFAQESAALLPNAPEVLEALGQAQAEGGETQQAISTFNKIVVLQPRSTRPFLRLADTYMLRGEPAGAVQALKRALEVSPGTFELQQRVIETLLRGKSYDQAVAFARDVQKQRANSAQGWSLEADVEVARKRWPEAVKLLRTAIDKPQAAERIPLRLYSVLQLAGQPADAAKFAAEWTRSHPKDLPFVEHLANFELGRKNYAESERRYREVLKLDPEFVTALNNLAWLMAKRGDKGALEFANRAVAERPLEAPLQDTLALALAAAGQMDQAIAVQRRVVNRLPQEPAFRLTLAKLYVGAGKKAEARAEIERLKKQGIKFAANDEMNALMKAIQ